MCGIAGYFALAERALAPRAVLERMVEAVRHRGPDQGGVHIEPRVALGHRRLSIIDLAGGRQPLATADGALWVTFNGEIFNYVELREALIARGRAFRTRSDTETILHAYAESGPGCVASFNGDFAYALWHRSRRVPPSPGCTKCRPATSSSPSTAACALSRIGSSTFRARMSTCTGTKTRRRRRSRPCLPTPRASACAPTCRWART